MQLSLTQDFLLLMLWQMKCLPDKYVKSKQVVIRFFSELDGYVCDSYSTVVQELYDLARPWKIETPLVDGHGNFGDPADPVDIMGADPKYTEVCLSEEGVKYIKSQGYDKIDRHALLKKHNIYYN
ncbi:MAG: hypothetical protein K2G07_09880 [Muribaculaceae bacterium]|nr:hypothetical protein [Muribaculaceae bacterium]